MSVGILNFQDYECRDDENIGLEYEDIERLSEQNPENSKQNSKRNSNKNSEHRKKESESELSDII
ncbi:hypothetical protein RhiirA5_423161 [Rhizophagus irregularis]|uniref:Uncharacterized protein n=2 Tax=Rhizophagus irregularis TaxID=588596 RepID=A0A2N0PAI5_9GLOM|nr:hypothetical protein RhiirA5_423161 [Rhizophagus irregularis]